MFTCSSFSLSLSYSAMEKWESGAAKNKYVLGGVKAVVSTSNCPMICVVCLLYFWCFILKLST